MHAVSRRPLLRSTAVIVGVPLLVAALWLVRSATTRMSDAEVRHGVRSRAVVLAVDGDHATVRIVRPTDTVVTVINRHASYAVGDTIRVVHDPVDPGRASELGAPVPSTALQRSLVVAAPIILTVFACWWYMRRHPEDDAEDTGRRDVVRGGRLLQPEPAR
jgi:hypothetical protein